MKQIWKKIPAIVGLLLSVLSSALVTGAFWLAETVDELKNIFGQVPPAIPTE